MKSSKPRFIQLALFAVLLLLGACAANPIAERWKYENAILSSVPLEQRYEVLQSISNPSNISQAQVPHREYFYDSFYYKNRFYLEDTIAAGIRKAR